MALSVGASFAHFSMGVEMEDHQGKRKAQSVMILAERSAGFAVSGRMSPTTDRTSKPTTVSMEDAMNAIVRGLRLVRPTTESKLFVSWLQCTETE